MFKITHLLLALSLALVTMPAARAHAFPQNSSPHVGSTLAASPTTVEVWFDGEIEPVFSTLVVENAAGTQVSQGNGQVSSSDNTLLETTLPASLPAGQYFVYWSVIARDGHHTAGRFPFTVQ
ncbi:MAG: copper resistance CopC family protein [Gammaproteobacteria bacterium]